MWIISKYLLGLSIHTSLWDERNGWFIEQIEDLFFFYICKSCIEYAEGKIKHDIYI